MVNDDWRMMNERMIFGKDNSPLINDKWVFSPKNERMIEWLNVLELFLMLSIDYMDYKLYGSKSILVEILI